MQIVYTGQTVPETLAKSIFLAGPTPRSKRTASWRPEALKILEELGYDGVVFVPEPRDGAKRTRDYMPYVEWEEAGLNMADNIVFWVPRKIKGMPAFTTNVEFGRWEDSGKVVFGAPPKAPKMDYLRYYAKKLHVPSFDNLRDTLKAALDMIGGGASRTGGEREVPLYIWRTRSFQQWYLAQKQAGNRLDGARVQWTFRVGPNRSYVFIWALHVNVFIAREGRNKTNEVVISRPNISTVVLYRRGKTLNDSDIVLIREFRSPAATDDGFVWEAPSGSSWKSKGSPSELAADECKEETGLRIKPSRLRYHNSRQLAATLSAHKANLFSAEITKKELDYLRSQRGIAKGVIEDTERTYIEIIKFGEIMRRSNVDWSMLGMILSVLSEEENNKEKPD